MLGAIFSLAVNNLSVDPQIFPPLLLLCVCGIPILPFAWSCLPGSLAWLSPLSYAEDMRHTNASVRASVHLLLTDNSFIKRVSLLE